jgi:type I restriction enzyme S subunit
MTVAKSFAVDHSESTLPEGWAWAVMDEMGKWNTGGTPSRKVPAYFGGGISWIKSGDLKNGTVCHTEETISRAGLENSAAILLPPGTVTIALYGATIGKLGILGIDAATNQACANCRVNEEITTNQFVFYYFLQQRDALIAAGQGGAQPNLTNQIVRDWPIPLPPMAEQKRIVEKVEQLLAYVNAARERLARVPTTFKRFRQAVLASACSGRRTGEWRESNPVAENGRALIERVEWEQRRNARANMKSREYPFEPPDNKELPANWVWSSFGLVTRNCDGRRVPIRADDRAKRKGRFPYYGASGVIDSIDDFLFDGDYLLIGEDGANLLSRSTPIAFRASGKFWVNNHAHVVQAFAGIPLAYLETYVNEIDLQEFVTGTAQPKLTQDALNRIPVPIPPLLEQHEIVRRVDALFNLADGIEQHVAEATARTDKLTQAILAKAFRGELVPTEAELARRAGRSYEPASVLLARIRAERELLNYASKTGSKKIHHEAKKWQKKIAGKNRSYSSKS